jgi:hypothetical protein
LPGSYILTQQDVDGTHDLIVDVVCGGMQNSKTYQVSMNTFRLFDQEALSLLAGLTGVPGVDNLLTGALGNILTGGANSIFANLAAGVVGNVVSGVNNVVNNVVNQVVGNVANTAGSTIGGAIGGPLGGIVGGTVTDLINILGNVGNVLTNKATMLVQVVPSPDVKVSSPYFACQEPGSKTVNVPFTITSPATATYKLTPSKGCKAQWGELNCSPTRFLCVLMPHQGRPS